MSEIKAKLLKQILASGLGKTEADERERIEKSLELLSQYEDDVNYSFAFKLVQNEVDLVLGPIFLRKVDNLFQQVAAEYSLLPKDEKFLAKTIRNTKLSEDEKGYPGFLDLAPTIVSLVDMEAKTAPIVIELAPVMNEQGKEINSSARNKIKSTRQAIESLYFKHGLIRITNLTDLIPMQPGRNVEKNALANANELIKTSIALVNCLMHLPINKTHSPAFWNVFVRVNKLMDSV